MDPNLSKELQPEDIYVKEEITDQIDSNIADRRQNEIVCKRAYYQCITCSVTFTMAEKLKDHEDIHKGEKSATFKIDLNVIFLVILILKFKYLFTDAPGSSNYKTQEYQCQQCPKRYNRKNNLNYHVTMKHTGIHKRKRYECFECGKQFHYNSHLKQHENIHLKIKPHGCPHCDMRFARSDGLKRHIRTYTGEKPHGCPHCDMKFSTSRNFKVHIRQHTGKNIMLVHSAK